MKIIKQLKELLNRVVFFIRRKDDDLDNPYVVL
jgi:hypothetical protein